MLVKQPDNIRIAMLGMVDGNGHPLSWSAIINGRFDARAIIDAGYQVIADYLGAQPAGALGIPGVAVTHVWCDDPADAERVSRAAFVPNIATRPEDVIGHVDAVMIPTDRGGEHVDRCRPFIEAGLPVFVDKPLADNEADLRRFIAWRRAGKAILSSSCMRYAKEFAVLRDEMPGVGAARLVTTTTPKSWERYGIHALEAAYPLLPAGRWEWVAHTGDHDAAIVHARHGDGVDLVIAAIDDLYGAMGCVNVYGTQGVRAARFADRFGAFKSQLESFVSHLRTGVDPYPFDETVELMRIIIAGIRSRDEGGRRVRLDEVRV